MACTGLHGTIFYCVFIQYFEEKRSPDLPGITKGCHTLGGSRSVACGAAPAHPQILGQKDRRYLHPPSF